MAKMLAIASGKGGVGTTTIVANLALALANEGLSITAVDLALGSSNLNGSFGLPNRFPGVGDYILSSNQGDLEEFLVSSGFDNVAFLAGDGRTPFLADISWPLRQRLLKELPKLPSDLVLLDLRSGWAFSTIDFLVGADCAFLVASPSRASAMGVLSLCKNMVLRAAGLAIHKDKTAMSAFADIVRRPLEEQGYRLVDIVEEISAASPACAELIWKACQKLQPQLLLSQVKGACDGRLVTSMAKQLHERLNLELPFFGSVDYDELVGDGARSLVVHHKPESKVAADFKELAKRTMDLLAVAR